MSHHFGLRASQFSQIYFCLWWFVESFSSVSSNEFVYLHLPSSAACSEVDEVWREVEQEMKGDPAVSLRKVDVATSQEALRQAGAEGVPSFYWQGANDQYPEIYDGGHTSHEIVTHIKRKRSGKFEKNGRVAELDSIANRFLTSSDQSALYQEAAAIAAQVSPLDTRAAKYYIKIMDKLHTHGNNFVASEIFRLQRLIGNSGAHIKANKLENLATHLNILQSFVRYDHDQAHTDFFG